MCARGHGSVEPETLHSLHGDHPGASDLLAQALRVPILGTVPPLPGPLQALELQDDDALRVPVAFEGLAAAATHHVTPAEGGDRRRRQPLVVLVPYRVQRLDL